MRKTAKIELIKILDYQINQPFLTDAFTQYNKLNWILKISFIVWKKCL